MPLPAIALTNDIAVVTAVGNDVGFDNIYARQVIAFDDQVISPWYFNERQFN